MKTNQKLFENFHKNKSLLAPQVTSFLSNKMAITRSFFIRSRRAIRRNLRLEKTNQIVKFPGHKTILKGPKYPFQFRPELKSHLKHSFQKSNIVKILKPLLMSQKKLKSD